MNVGECHELLSELCDYIDGDLDGRICLELEEHLKTCSHCSSCITTMRLTITMCREHLDSSIPPDVSDRLMSFLDEKCFGGECL